MSGDRTQGGRGDDRRRGGSRSGGDARRGADGRERGRARTEGQGHRSARAPSERRRGADLPRTVAHEVLRAVDESDAYANLVLPRLLRDRRLRGRDAAFTTELAYGTLRMRGRYDAIIATVADRPVEQIDANLLDVLRLGVHQLLGMRVPPHAAVSETVGLARAVVGAGPAQMVNAVLRRVSEHPVETWLERIADAVGGDETDRLAVVHSHPAWVVRALRQALVAHGREAAEIESLLAAHNDAAAVTLVVRPGLMERDDVIAATPDTVVGRWTPTAVTLPAGDPGLVPGVADGRVGVQDEGSQLVALALAHTEVTGRDERWLDLCAGPGGKAALLGALAATRGAQVVANELQTHRVELVRGSVAAVPAGAVEVREGDGRAVGGDEPEAYDRVLVDVPCTGLGALRRRPESRWRRRPSDLGPLGALQRDLLASALDATRPGGVVAYVTCSPHVAETELVVRDVTRRRDDVEVLDARTAVRAVAGDEIPLGPGPHVQLWPHVHGTDAMFLALLRRRA